jgi:hypothetical protein
MHDGPATPPGDDAAAGALAAALDALRLRGAAQRAPVRWRQLEAFARRAAAYDGAARRLLDARLAELVRVFAAACEAPRADTAPGTPATPGRGPLGELAHGTGRVLPAAPAAPGAAGDPGAAPGRGTGPRTRAPGPRPADAAPGSPASTAPRRPAAADDESLQYFRRTWARLAADQHLAQSRSSLPGNAGPLHSHTLVHRSLALMRELAPGYFERFLAHVEALTWLEAAGD